MKYILITGGVLSSVGKGVITSSIGVLLKSAGYNVTAIKIDPYLNIDAGTFSPYEHGEVFVLNDGGEVDLDLGNYERFLDITLGKDNNITTGKVYKAIIENERRGQYLGKTVQVVPHVTDFIQKWVKQVGESYDVCLIELGGTIGDIESMAFIEAFSQFQMTVEFYNVHVSYVPELSEPKTKPTQFSVKKLRECGLYPNVLICRSKNLIPLSKKVKLANFCHISEHRVISVPDCPSIYDVPLILYQNNIMKFLNFNAIPENIPVLTPKSKSIKIALVGKYVEFDDSYTSVIEALKHASYKHDYNLELIKVSSEHLEDQWFDKNASEYHKAYYNLCIASGIIVPGGFDTRGINGMVKAIQYARTKKIPFLGICLGFQVAVIEYARNVLNLDANSTEFDIGTLHPVIKKICHSENLGNTMRLGGLEVILKQDSKIYQMYKKEIIVERHRHRYGVNPEYIHQLEENGLKFTGFENKLNQYIEVLEIDDHPYFIATQFHAEYLSRLSNPAPVYDHFIESAL